MFQLKRSFWLLLIGWAGSNAHADGFDCSRLPLAPVIAETSADSPTGDFSLRDILPRTEVPAAQWRSCCGSYGPCALPYPRVSFPPWADHSAWGRVRLVAAAKRFLGTPYAHHHIPDLGGLDCSNFTAFVYNYAFGIRISSNVKTQSASAGRRLGATEPLRPGDLIFLRGTDGGRITHALIYLSEEEIIDSTGPGVAVRPFRGWYREKFAWARRLLE